MWRDEEFLERNRTIFYEEFDGFLPERILDFHVHIFNEGVFTAADPYTCAGHDIPKYDLGELESDMRDVLPERAFHAVCFGSPSPERDIVKNNAYIAARCDGKRYFPLKIFDPKRDGPDALEDDAAEKRFMGLKPYLTFARKPDPNDVEIADMLPDWSMAVADRHGWIIMLHIPRRLRLADPLNISQIRDLSVRYPNAKIVLAHLGRAYFMKNVVSNLDKLADLDNVWFDISMLNHWEVLEYAFKTVSADKLLYASDTPIALAPGKSVEINDQYTYVTPVPWNLSISDDHGKLVFTSFLYEELRAIKKAVSKSRLGDNFVDKLFFRNGMALLKSV